VNGVRVADLDESALAVRSADSRASPSNNHMSFVRSRKPQMQFYRLIHQFQICLAHHPNKFRRLRFVYRANVLRLNLRGLRQRGMLEVNFKSV
jgi:hypothetical protein